MKTTQDDHRVQFDDIKEGVPEHSQKYSTHFRMNGRVGLWIVRDEAGCCGDRFEESVSKSGLSFFVPVKR
jgi:hypothetical protein